MTDLSEIRRTLVEGIRNDPSKPFNVKRAAEVLIGVIDAEGTIEAFDAAYRELMLKAEGHPFAHQLTAQEIAKALGLGARHQ